MLPGLPMLTYFFWTCAAQIELFSLHCIQWFHSVLSSVTYSRSKLGLSRAFSFIFRFSQVTFRVCGRRRTYWTYRTRWHCSTPRSWCASPTARTAASSASPRATASSSSRSRRPISARPSTPSPTKVRSFNFFLDGHSRRSISSSSYGKIVASLVSFRISRTILKNEQLKMVEKSVFRTCCLNRKNWTFGLAMELWKDRFFHFY